MEQYVKNRSNNIFICNYNLQIHVGIMKAVICSRYPLWGLKNCIAYLNYILRYE